MIKKGIEDNVTEFEYAVLLALHRNIDSVKRTGEDTNQNVRQLRSMVELLVYQERVTGKYLKPPPRQLGQAC